MRVCAPAEYPIVLCRNKIEFNIISIGKGFGSLSRNLRVKKERQREDQRAVASVTQTQTRLIRCGFGESQPRCAAGVD